MLTIGLPDLTVPVCLAVSLKSILKPQQYVFDLPNDKPSCDALGSSGSTGTGRLGELAVHKWSGVSVCSTLLDLVCLKTWTPFVSFRPCAYARLHCHAPRNL